VETGQAGRGWQRDAELAPVALARIPKLLQRGAEHVLDGDQLAVGRDDEALRTDRAVRHLARALVKGGDGGDQLPDETQRRGDVEAEAALLRVEQQLRKADAVHPIRDDRERGIAIAQSFNGAGASELFVAEDREAAHPLAERELERRNGGELALEAQLLQRL